MKNGNRFHEVSYQKHSSNYDDYSIGGKKESIAKTWLDRNSVGAWRFERMYHLLDPLLEAEPHARWLTVGDGRYGGDAQYILYKGVDVLATDITDALLKEAQEMGCLKKFRKENAESLSFGDSEFDFVLCKEAYHHFPRPMMALYEMLRVASEGVVLIEPTDLYVTRSIATATFRKLLNIVKTLLGKSSQTNFFEEVGNYVYTISRREIEKVAMGLNYKVVAFHGVNDYYLKGCEFENISENGINYRKIRFMIALLNILTKLKLVDYSLTAVIIFKRTPSEKLMDVLRKGGYEVVRLPTNPYAAA